MHDPASLPPDHGEQFGQEERLTVRLRGLIRSYPRSIGIIKEILQNADDAGASWLRVLWDDRDATAQAGEPRLARLLGRALLFASDQRFTDADLRAIRRIGESSKSELGPKTGRFGLGFNTVYNVTDHPSFVSGPWVICFDPHRSAVAAPGEPPGRRWRLADLWREAPAWISTFCAAGLAPGAEEHPGTIFRLPARTPALAASSEICGDPFGREHIEPILRDLWEFGDELLLFARSVHRLEAAEIDADGRPRELISLSTLNLGELQAARAVTDAAVAGDLRELLPMWRAGPEDLAHVTYRHHIEARGPRGVERRPWQLSAGLFADTYGELLRLNEEMLDLGERAIPWAGAAIRLEERGDGEATEGEPLRIARQHGRVFCTFHLPDQTNTVPLHLNACFDLDSSRRQISADAAAYGAADRVRVAWNRALLAHAVPRAAAAAIEALAPDIAARAITNFYALWPDLRGRDGELWGVFARALTERLAHLPLIRTRTGPTIDWQPLADTRLPPPLWGEDLQEALRDDGLTLPDPELPARLAKGAEAVDLRPPRHKPAELRAWLRQHPTAGEPLAQAPLASLRERSHVVDLLQFCISDRKDELAGLPLALTSDGHLRTFGAAGPLYLADEPARELFADALGLFIDPGVQAGTRLQPHAAADLHEMGPTQLLARLALTLRPDSLDAPLHRRLDPAWHLRVVRFLAQRVPPAHAPEIEGLALLPDQFGRLHAAAGRRTPILIPPDPLAPALHAALDALGVPLLSGSPELIHALRELQERHGAPITPFGPHSLAACLAEPDVARALAQLPVDAITRAALLDALAAPTWLDAYDEPTCRALAQLPLFRPLAHETDPNVSKDRDLLAPIAALAPGVYLPAGFAPPARPDLQLRLLDPGPDGRWRPFLERLGAAPLTFAAFVRERLLPAYPALSREDQREALRWLRDHPGRKTLASADPQLSAELRAAPLILGRDGHLHPAHELCDLSPPPDAAPTDPTRDDDEPDIDDIFEDMQGRPSQGRPPRPSDIFSELADAPDLAFYSDDLACWRELFAWLGIRGEPRPRGLLERIDALIAAAAHDLDAATPGLLALLTHLSGRWPTLRREAPEEAQQLAADLLARVWLPGERHGHAALYAPNHLYLPQHRPLLATQAPLLACPAELLPLSPELIRDLGLDAAPPPLLVLDHLIQRCDELLAASAPARADEPAPKDILHHEAPAIYAYLGDPDAPWDPPLLAQLRARAAAHPCVWDPARQRLWRPAHAFAVPIAELFGDRRAYVPGEGDARSGLDRLGRRQSVSQGDVLALLYELRDQHHGAPLPADQLALVLRLLRRFDDLAGDAPAPLDLPVPADDGRLLAAAELWVADAPWFGDRLSAAGLAHVHPRVSDELLARASIRRLSRDVRERLAEEPARSGSHDKQAFCAQITATLRHPALLAGLRRLLGAGDATDLSRLAALEICACDRLVTTLELVRDDRELGREEVPVFADVAAGVVYISGDHWDTVVVQIVAAIRRILGDPSLDPAHLEALLRADPSDMRGVLDLRRVPRRRGDDDHADPELPSAPTAAPAPPRPIAVGAAHERIIALQLQGAAPPLDLAVIEAAVARVVAHERGAGRSPERMPLGHPAYDVQSGEIGAPGARYIRVVGLDGPWDRIPVTLSKAHLEASRRFLGHFWLYVVEHACDPAKATLHRLSDPAGRVARYTFDARWAAQAEKDRAASAPQVGWIHHPIGGEAAVIDAIEAAGFFTWLHVRRPDGGAERRFFKPGLDRLLPPER